ncbi:MAG: carboxypeptidase regulatory-like domain-containing protein [Verrucomicrobia bacterium]|nr:carboxypeptidase regulatory-like domain-containing protein [Verrucomicrobiota bacterium]
MTLTNCTLSLNTVTGGHAGTGGAAGSALFPGNSGSGGVGGAGNGAGIFNLGTLTLAACTLDDNLGAGGDSAKAASGPFGSAPNGSVGGDSRGGGICNLGTNVLVNCTLFRNVLYGGAGGDGGDGDAANGQGGRGGDGGAAWGGGFYSGRWTAMTNCTLTESGTFGGLPGAGGNGALSRGDGAAGVSRGGNLANSNNVTFLLKNSLFANPPSGTNVVVRTNVNTSTSYTCVTNTAFDPISGTYTNGVTCTTNTTVTTNVVTTTNVFVGMNAYGTFTDAGFNLSSDTTPAFATTNSFRTNNVLLGVLATNSGVTATLALLPGSPALDRGDPAFVLPTDQRGTPRPQGPHGDIGAYEAEIISLTGLVTLGTEGLSGVSVLATLGTATNVAMTDTSGRYTFTNLPPDDYTVTPVLSGYLFDPPSANVNVTLFGSTNDFRAALLQVVSLSGWVLDGTSGLAGVTVSLGGTSLAATTDADGRYAFTNLAFGTYTVVPSKTGFEFSPPVSQAVVNSVLATNDFEAIGLYAIVGRVIAGPAHAGLADVTVRSETRSTVTDSEGYYLLLGIGPGTHQVIASRTKYAFLPATNEVQVTTDLVGGLDFEGFETFVLSGRIYDGEDLSGNSVLSNVVVGLTSTVTTADGSSATLEFSALSDANGDYVFTNAPGGLVVVTPALARYRFERGGSPDFTGTLTADLTGIDFAGYRSFAISGRVTFNGAGLPGVIVMADASEAATDDSGNYALTDIDAFDSGGATNVFVMASHPGYVLLPASIEVLRSTNNVSNVNFTAAGALAISGVFTWTNTPVTNVTVTVSNQILSTGTRNSFILSNLPPGEYGVTPHRSGYDFSPVSAVVTLTTNDALTNFLAIPRLTVRGRVTNAGTGTGLAGVTLTAGSATATTDGSGNYTMINVSAINQVVPATNGYWFLPSSRRLDQEPDATKIHFTASPTLSISGRLLEGTNGVANFLVTAIASNLANSTETKTLQINAASSGSYSFGGLVPGTYAISPPPQGVGFTPASAVVVLSTTNITNLNFTANLPRLLLSRGTNGPPSELLVLALPSRFYQVQAATNLTPSIVWSNFWTSNTAPSGAFTVPLTNSAAYRARFFRVRTP